MAGIEDFLKQRSKNSADEANKRKSRAVQSSEDDDYNDDDDFMAPPSKRTQTTKSVRSQTKKARSGKEDSEQPSISKATSSKATEKAQAPPRAKRKADSQSKATDDGDDDFQQSKSAKKSGSKSGFYNMMHRAPPSALGTRPKPVGKDGCLQNMTFVLSGEFDTITKDDISDIIKTYGGRVTSAVSGKTTYLLRGRDAGESKLAKAKQLKTKIIDENGFYDLVEKSAGESQPSSSKSTESSKKQAPKSASTPKPSASSKATAALSTSVTSGSNEDILWTEKYKPKSLTEIIGNKAVIERLSSWLGNWQDNRKKNFPEGEGSQGFRAVLISGPPGIGKTTTAQLLAKEHGYSAMELNASDTRNKSILGELVTETTLNRSMTEFFTGGGSSRNDAKLKKSTSGHGKLVLIMDEVDGMSGGDRGGSAELARLIRSTNIPIICVCNDARSDKVKPLLKVCSEAKFTRTPARNMRNQLMKIAKSENLNIEPNALDELVTATGNDIRQIINILSTYRLCSTNMKYGDAKSIGSQNQKYSQISLFDIPGQLLGNSRWQHPNINELADIYFHDYGLSYLMIYENYTSCAPAKARKGSGSVKENDCMEMDLFAEAANAIADGDLVDRRIGLNQEYSLMPVHSIFSCVQPASYIHGSLAGKRLGFPQWLGQSSKTTKNYRLLADIQNKVRSKATVDLSEIRQHYVPALTCNLFTDINKGECEKAMDTMDFYYLDRENLETLSDVALSAKPPMNTLPSAAKRNLNKLYKSRAHPLLFQLSDTKPLKNKTKTTKEDYEGTIFDVEPDIGEVTDTGEITDADGK